MEHPAVIHKYGIPWREVVTYSVGFLQDIIEFRQRIKLRIIEGNIPGFERCLDGIFAVTDFAGAAVKYRRPGNFYLVIAGVFSKDTWNLKREVPFQCSCSTS